MKRFMALLLAIMLVMSGALVACGEKAETEKSDVKVEETKDVDTTESTTDATTDAVEAEETTDEEFASVDTSKTDYSELQYQENLEMDSSQYLNFFTGEPVTLDTGRSSISTSWNCQGPIFEGLTRLQGTPSGAAVIEPGVAESWEANEAGDVYTFHLREDAKWQDGQPVVAEDFVYSWVRMLDPATGSPYAWLITPIIKNAAAFNNGEANAEDVGVKAVDARTFQVTLEKPTPYFMQLSYFPTLRPMRKDAVDAAGEAYGAEGDSVIGNGPFIIDEWIHRGKIVFKKNPHYWDAKHVYIDQMTWNMIDDEGARMQAMLAGDIDSGGVTAREWQEQFDSTEEFNVISLGDVNSGYHLMNCADRYFKNDKIRKAFSAALDRDDYVEVVTNGTQYPGWWYVPNNMSIGDELFNEKNGVPNYVRKLYDDVRAENGSPRDLLIAGLKELGEDEDPANMDVTMQFRGTSEKEKQRGEYYQQVFKEELGVNIKVALLQYNIVYANIDSGEYQICDVGWNGDYNDPHTMFEFWHSSKGYYDKSKTGWENAEFDGIVEEAGSILDNDKRSDLYNRAEEILVYEDCVIAPYEQGKYSTYRRKYIKNYFTVPTFFKPDYKYVYTNGRK